MYKKKKKNDMKSKDEPPRFKDIQYTTGEEWRTNTSCRKNEVAGRKQKQHSVVDVSGDESKSSAAKNSIAQDLEC